MGRKKKHEEHANHEAWAIPYGDLLTLLLAFFVVMYAISSINEGKYRIMADAMSTAFGGPPRTIKQVQVGNEQLRGAMNDTAATITTGSTAQSQSDPSRLSAVNSAMRKPINVRDAAAIEQAARQLKGISDRITKALAPLIDRGMITVRRTELWIEVEINSDILFASSSATLSRDARQTLMTLAEVLQDAPNNLRVEGHTDNMPIATAQYPSNWELSAARAASVVHLFAGNGVSPDRLSMVGYGEFRPREANADKDARNRNRRVMVVILADSAASIDPLNEQLLSTLDPDAGSDASATTNDDSATRLPDAAATPKQAPTAVRQRGQALLHQGGQP